MSQSFVHQSVLLAESLEALNIRPDGIYVDATFGRGGHSREILKRLSQQGRLLVFDKDPEAITVAKGMGDDRMEVIHASFSKLREVVSGKGWLGKIDGILMDLGVSSPQIDDATRGFSFTHEGPLDMRMNTAEGLSAAQWLATVDEKDLSTVLWEYGEERYSRRVARNIVQARAEQPIQTTRALANIVEKSIPKSWTGPPAAMRSFQAIRIFLNRELEDLKAVLSQVLEVLSVGGRLCVVSFHSLEDRLVKQFIAKTCEGEPLPRGLPIRDAQRVRVAKKIGGLVRPSETEVNHNPRARSARLRTMEKIA